VTAEPLRIEGAADGPAHQLESAALVSPEGRVGLVSTWETHCGIADYTANLRRGLEAAGIASGVVPIDRRTVNYLSMPELHEYYADVARQLRGARVAHIQHDFGFYGGQHSTGASIEVFGGLLSALIKQRTPTVVTFHTNPVFLLAPPRDTRARAVRQYYRALWRIRVAGRINRAATVQGIVHSRSTRLAMVRSGLAPARLSVLRHAATAAAPAAAGAGAAIRRELGIPEEATTLGLFGFMSRYKGYHIALEAMRHLPDNVHLLILGAPHPFSTDSALEEVLMTLAKRRALRPRVHLVGYIDRSRLAAYQAAVDICVAPYTADLGMSASGALMWALASGKPVVATKIPAFAEINEEYDCLHMASPDASREVAYRVRELMERGDLAQRLSANAREYCRENTWDQHVVHLAEIYSTIQPSR